MMVKQLQRALPAAALLSVCLGAAGGPLPGRPPHKAFAPIGRMDTAVIKESSGIVKSPRHAGIFWTHNDSLNEPVLFAVKADGELVAALPVTGAPNVDWEDIAVADGFLYVGDIGNNTGWLRVRAVYKFAEPDPYADPIEPLEPVATYRYTFPNEPFDAEALIVRGTHIYLIRKAGGQASAVYRLTPTDGEPMSLTEVLSLRSGWITGADLSDDGRFLVTVSGHQLARYPVTDDLTLRTDEAPRFVYYRGGGQIEACCFDGDDVVLTSEQGFVYRISAQDIERQTRFVAPRRGEGK